MSVTFWGVRGSAPVSGLECLSFGGSTMCLEVEAGERRVILDAGSGIRQLGLKLREQFVPNIDIVLTHFHLDHVMGLTTFSPLFQKDVSVTVHAPILQEGHPEAILHRLLGEPFFPVPMKNAGASFTIRGFHPGDIIPLNGHFIRTASLSHPGGSCGYRFDCNGRSVAVITDHEHSSARPEPSLVKLCRGVDMIVYDAHWDEDLDYEAHRGWGHSTWQAGLRLMQAAGAGRLGCLHHAPEATDGTLLAREARLNQIHPASFFAREGKLVLL
ncbi:MAG: MBL fold metallo-hydrolase [Beijerinckiaceae bacterium]